MTTNNISNLLNDKVAVNELLERITFSRRLQKLNGKDNNVTVNVPKRLVEKMQLRKGQIVNIKLERKDGKADGEYRIVITPTQEYTAPETVAPEAEKIKVLDETAPAMATA